MPPKKARGPTVTVSRSFAAVVRKRGPHANVVFASPSYYQNELNRLRDGERVTVTVSNRKLKRSDQQNAYYWGAYLPLIAAETGERDVERLHELFKGKFLTKRIVEVMGEKVRIKGSTTSLSVSEFCQYIMDIEGYTGVAAPPTESYDLAPLGGAYLHDDDDQAKEG